ncbi:MAG: DUF1801 domain-containing protein [Candidatus Thermoplasmatota archaeon]|nr:DUF1801 domain-containing protein [Candidatus Thermoplasmatota archaeon]
MISRKKPSTIDEYIIMFPNDVQVILKKLRQTIQDAAPTATEAIRYQMPTFQLAGKNMVHFAAFSHDIGFYPIPSGIAAFKKELKGFKHGKGSVQFRMDKPVPYDLVRRIVLFRVKELVQTRKKGKSP